MCVSSGSSGEEVLLSERRLQEKDIEDPLAAQSQERSQQHPAAGDLSHSESSDNEQEQDFVSSVVSQRQGPRVHWGDLPKRRDEDNRSERGKMERPRKQGSWGAERGERLKKDENRQESVPCPEAGAERDGEDPEKLLSSHTDKPDGEQVSEEEGLPQDPSVEEAAAKLNLCSLSETVTHTKASESKHLPSSTLINGNQHSHNMALTGQPELNITQVGMSKRGAAGLRDLLKNHTAGAKADSIRQNLLECLRRTLKEWSTDETLKFLYGADYSLGSPFSDVKEEKEEEEEELDEDDLDDEVTDEGAEKVDAGVQNKASAAIPDYEALQKESQQLELRVREFYKGTWILPEEVEEPPGDEVSEGGRERGKKRK